LPDFYRGHNRKRSSWTTHHLATENYRQGIICIIYTFKDVIDDLVPGLLWQTVLWPTFLIDSNQPCSLQASNKARLLGVLLAKAHEACLDLSLPSCMRGNVAQILEEITQSPSLDGCPGGGLSAQLTNRRMISARRCCSSPSIRRTRSEVFAASNKLEIQCSVSAAGAVPLPLILAPSPVHNYY